MLLNDDIQKKLFKWFYTFKKINVIMYIIEIFLKKNSNHFMCIKPQ